MLKIQWEASTDDFSSVTSADKVNISILMDDPYHSVPFRNHTLC